MSKYRDLLARFSSCDMLVVKLDTDLSKFIENPIASYLLWEFGPKLSESLVSSNLKSAESILFADNSFMIPRILILSKKISTEKTIFILNDLKPKKILFFNTLNKSINSFLEKANFIVSKKEDLENLELSVLKRVAY